MRTTLQILVRMALTLGLLAVTFVSYGTFAIPRFGADGLLGLTNLIIVAYLLILVSRHFLILFFATRENIRKEALPEVQEWPAISVIVPAYNEAVVVGETIKSLAAMDYPSIEVVVVDDGSSDDTFEVAKAAAAVTPNVRVFTKKNAGKGAALNFGIEHARHDLVFCMDADSQVDAAAFRYGVRHLQEPDVAAVAGSVLVLNQDSWLGRFQALEYLIGLNFYKAAQSFLGLVTIIPGPSGLFRKRQLQEIGGYHSDTFAEDCDITLRLVMAGHRIVFEPRMEVRTEVPASIQQLIKQRYRWNRGILQATRKHLAQAVRPWRNPTGALIVAYMAAEALLLPTLNLAITLLSLVYTALMLDFSLLSLWLIQLTLLDLSVVTFVLTDRRWSLGLGWLAIVSRFTYAFFLEIIKALSSLEEVVGIQMNWGKLDRIGTKRP